MKRILIGVTTLIVALGAPRFAPVQAQVGTGQDGETWVRGQVVCRTCYLKNKANTEMAHEGVPEHDGGMPELCAKMCSMKGMPLALLTEEGELYTVTGPLAAKGDVLSVEKRVIRANEPNAALVNHLTHTMVVGGKIVETNGERQIVGDKFDWNMDNKDWRVGSTRETKHTEGAAVWAPGSQAEGGVGAALIQSGVQGESGGIRGFVAQGEDKDKDKKDDKDTKDKNKK